VTFREPGGGRARRRSSRLRSHDRLPRRLSLPLAQLSQDIHQEVGEQNSVLDAMREGMENAGSTVQKTMGALGTMFEAGGSKQMTYVVGGVVLLFLVLYFFVKKVF
jgi:t-SNARE complex subunit (syntaxin)